MRTGATQSKHSHIEVGGVRDVQKHDPIPPCLKKSSDIYDFAFPLDPATIRERHYPRPGCRLPEARIKPRCYSD